MVDSDYIPIEDVILALEDEIKEYSNPKAHIPKLLQYAVDGFRQSAGREETLKNANKELTAMLSKKNKGKKSKKS